MQIAIFCILQFSYQVPEAKKMKWKTNHQTWPGVERACQPFVASSTRRADIYPLHPKTLIRATAPRADSVPWEELISRFRSAQLSPLSCPPAHPDLLPSVLFGLIRYCQIFLSACSHGFLSSFLRHPAGYRCQFLCQLVAVVGFHLLFGSTGKILLINCFSYIFCEEICWDNILCLFP